MKPCEINPDPFFAEAEQFGSYKERLMLNGAEARMICLTQCPLHVQRRCARDALKYDDEYGVRAALFLPGHQHRNRPKLLRARGFLEKIASGQITSDEVPENEQLLEIHDAHHRRVS